MPTFVQFTHPGKEHSVSKSEISNGIKQWNYDEHRRKFIKAKGLYVTNQGSTEVSDLLFWGEWEPESKVFPLQNMTIGDYPSYVHIPCLQKNSSGVLTALPYIVKDGMKSYRRNTDPFVFGFDSSCTDEIDVRLHNGEFYYSCCKQARFYKKSGVFHQTMMAQLELGSIILFGSTINPQSPNKTYFALDTVFVVGDYRDYTTSPYGGELDDFVPDEYIKIEGDDLFASKTSQSHFRLYKGATPARRHNGMYSFVPCKKTSSETIGFERVKLCQQDFANICKIIGIPVSDLFTDNLNTAPKITKSLSEADTKLIWETVRNIVRKQGCLEGVSFVY